MSDPIPERAWTLLQHHELAEIWVARTLLVHGRLVWAAIEVRNYGSEPLLIDITADEAPRLSLHTGRLAHWMGRRFDRERRETLAKLRATRGVVARRLASGERWRLYSEPLERARLDDAKFVGWSASGCIALLGSERVHAFVWDSPEMPWPPELRAVDQPPPSLGQVDPNPETLSALLHARVDELEPTNSGIGVVTRNAEFRLWGFERDAAELRPDHAACLTTLRRALDRLPKDSFNVSVSAGTSVRFAERWPGCGVDALADARVDAVRSALGLLPANPGMNTKVEDVGREFPVSSEDPRGIAGRRTVSCHFYGKPRSAWAYELDTVTAKVLELGSMHALLRTTDVGELFVGEHVGGPTVRELLRRQCHELAYLLAPQWLRPYPTWANGVTRLLRDHYNARDDERKRRVRRVKSVTAIFGFRCEVLAQLRGLFGGLGHGLGQLRAKLDDTSVACFDLLEVEGSLEQRLRELARRLRDIELDSDLGPALVVAAGEAIVGNLDVGEGADAHEHLGWAEFCLAVARPQLSDLIAAPQRFSI